MTEIYKLDIKIVENCRQMSKLRGFSLILFELALLDNEMNFIIQKKQFFEASAVVFYILLHQGEDARCESRRASPLSQSPLVIPRMEPNGPTEKMDAPSPAQKAHAHEMNE
jgi:hypothetical protein